MIRLHCNDTHEETARHGIVTGCFVPSNGWAVGLSYDRALLVSADSDMCSAVRSEDCRYRKPYHPRPAAGAAAATAAA
jgi:hypothetical protein